MIWTHKYDLLVKLLCIAAVVALFIPVSDYLELQGYPTHFGPLVFGLALVLAVIIYAILLRSVGTYLYARFTLEMPVSFAQAKKLNKAFAPLFPVGMKWLPMHELYGLPDEHKYEAALRIMDTWIDYKVERKDKEQKVRDLEPLNIKVARTVMVVLMISCFGLSVMNLPPASYLSRFTSWLFNENAYYPMLNFCVLVSPLLLIERYIKKRGGSGIDGR